MLKTRRLGVRIHLHAVTPALPSLHSMNKPLLSFHLPASRSINVSQVFVVTASVHQQRVKVATSTDVEIDVE